MEADQKRAVARVIRVGRLPIVALAAAFLMVGCGGSTETGNSNLRSDNNELRQENERLDEEVQRLQGEVKRLQGEVEDVRETAEPEVPETESTSQEDEVREAEPEESSGSGLAVAGPEDVSGEELPGIMPDDFPLPAVADYVSETEYNFSLNFVIDSEFDTTSAFYDGQLPAGGWEETDRTEGTVEGLKGVEITWERGTYIPEGSPQDSDYEQAKERLVLGVYEIEPSGVIVEIFWNDYELLSDDSEVQEEEQPSS